MNSMRARRGIILSAAVAAFVAPKAMGQVDNVVLLAGPTVATGGSAIGAAGYDPVHDLAYTTSFSNTGAVRKIFNFSSGSATSQVYVSNSEWNLYYRNGDPNQGIGTPLASGVTLNPFDIGSGANLIPAYSRAWITDAVTVPSPTPDPNKTMRVYTYNLQDVQDNPNPGNIPLSPPYYDGRDVFTTVLTLAQMDAKAGIAATNTTSNIGRQATFSQDGQRLYFVDSSNASTAVGGIWTINPLDNSSSRIYSAATLSDTEPAVVSQAPGVDRVCFQGVAAGSQTTDGIDYVDYNYSSPGAQPTRQTLLLGTDVRSFLETTATMTVTAVTVDPTDGSLYFFVGGGSGTTDRRVLVRRDAQGRLSVVASRAQRQAIFGTGINATMRKLQPSTYLYTNPSTLQQFNLTRILYTEPSSGNSLGAVYAFKPGDFNRDNALDQQDVALFKSALTLRGIAATTANLKFDMNGNGEVSYQDVKTFQSFYGFANGDANMDGTVNALDFNAVATNFGTAASYKWTDGDFTGDQIVNTADFTVLGTNFGVTTPPPSSPALGSLVPEPGSLIAGVTVGTLVWGRRKRVTR